MTAITSGDSPVHAAHNRPPQQITDAFFGAGGQCRRGA